MNVMAGAGNSFDWVADAIARALYQVQAQRGREGEKGEKESVQGHNKG